MVIRESHLSTVSSLEAKAQFSRVSAFILSEEQVNVFLLTSKCLVLHHFDSSCLGHGLYNLSQFICYLVDENKQSTVLPVQEIIQELIRCGVSGFTSWPKMLFHPRQIISDAWPNDF